MGLIQKRTGDILYTKVSALLYKAWAQLNSISLFSKTLQSGIACILAKRDANVAFSTNAVLPTTAFSQTLHIRAIRTNLQNIRLLSLVRKQNRSTEGCSKLKSPETRQAQEILDST